MRALTAVDRKNQLLRDFKRDRVERELQKHEWFAEAPCLVVSGLADLMVVSRDRGGTYASAAVQGAPQATQCADRFHLVKNLGETVEDLLARHLSSARKHQVQQALKEQAPSWQETRKARRSQTSEALPSVYQQDRLARYQQVIKLREQGVTQQAIAQQIGISIQTVQALARCGDVSSKHPSPVCQST